MPGIKTVNNLSVCHYADHNIYSESTSQEDKLTLLWSVTNSTGQRRPQLLRPYDVTFVGDEVLVVQGFWPLSNLHLFTSKGRSKAVIAKGQVLPFGVALTADGQFAMTDHYERTVKIINPSDGHISSWSPRQFNWPNGICTDLRDHFVITDWSTGLVHVTNTSGQNSLVFSTCTDPSKGSGPEYIATDSHHRIILTDSLDNTVKVFDDSGNLLLKFGQEKLDGNIREPRGVAIDCGDNILVADWGLNLVKKFSSDGKFIEDLLHPNQINHPWGIALKHDGQVAVTEQKLNACPALKVFEPNP